MTTQDLREQWAIPEKIQTDKQVKTPGKSMSSTYLGGRGVEEIDFPGVLMKKHVEIPGLN